MFYVYIHSRADTGEPFYVGKGTGRRLRSTSGRSEYWRRIVAKHGLRAEIVAQFEVESDAHAHEIEAIKTLRAFGFTLCNLTDGGEGASGYKHDAESKRKIGAGNRGRVFGPEVRKAMSDGGKGKILSSEHRAKLAAVLKRPRSAQHIAKIRLHAIELNKKNTRRVLCVDTQHTFESSKDAALWLRWQGFTLASNVGISKAARGELVRTCGYRWKYVS